MTPGLAAAIGYGLLGGLTFALYGWDKWRAQRAGRRVPESRLHLLALLGGFPGAWLGMRVFRHKTRKPIFLVLIIIAALLHGGAWTAWALGRSEG